MKTGTCYFPSLTQAHRYYYPYYGDKTCAVMDQKLKTEEIHIGKPPLKPGERLVIEDGRYHIIEEQKP